MSPSVHWSLYFLIVVKKKKDNIKITIGTSLAVQWLKLGVSTAGHTGLVPDGGTKIPYNVQPKNKKIHPLVHF